MHTYFILSCKKSKISKNTIILPTIVHNTQKNFLQSKTLGGIHIVSIHDEHGNLIWREKKGKKQSAVSFRPWFIGKKYTLKIFTNIS